MNVCVLILGAHTQTPATHANPPTHTHTHTHARARAHTHTHSTLDKLGDMGASRDSDVGSAVLTAMSNLTQTCWTRGVCVCVCVCVCVRVCVCVCVYVCVHALRSCTPHHSPPPPPSPPLPPNTTTRRSRACRRGDPAASMDTGLTRLASAFAGTLTAADPPLRLSSPNIGGSECAPCLRVRVCVRTRVYDMNFALMLRCNVVGRIPLPPQSAKSGHNPPTTEHMP
jgi:hypothetical protein